MAYMKSTPDGTIGAFIHQNGIACGIYGKGNCISLEYNHETHQLELLLMDNRINEQNFVIKHVNREWKEK